MKKLLFLAFAAMFAVTASAQDAGSWALGPRLGIYTNTGDTVLGLGAVGRYRFNNSNWPHILRAMRIWCVAVMAGWVPAYALVHGVAAALLPDMVMPFVLMFLFFPVLFGGLFAPIYAVGKKYE